MGYDRNDPWMTCGERDDRDVSQKDIEAILYEHIRSGFDGYYGVPEAAHAIMQKFIILSARPNGER